MRLQLLVPVLTFLLVKPLGWIRLRFDSVASVLCVHFLEGVFVKVDRAWLAVGSALIEVLGGVGVLRGLSQIVESLCD